MTTSDADLVNGTSNSIGREVSERADPLATKPVQVLIVHEVRLLHEGLTQLLREEPEVTVVGASPCGTTPARHQKCPADVVLLDASVRLDPEALGNKIQRFNRKWPLAKVIVMGITDSATEILGCIEAGASGYTLASYSVKELIDTIKMVHTREASCPPEMLAHLFERVTWLSRQVHSVQADLSNLTQREWEVLHLIEDGMTNKEISLHLNLELQTVKNYVHHLLQKLQVRNRREAAVYKLKTPILQSG